MPLTILLSTALFICLLLLLWRETRLRRLLRRVQELEQRSNPGLASVALQGSAQPVTLSGLHILMAGNRGNAQLELSLLLTRLGAAVDHVENGQLAIQAVLHGAITHDVLLLEAGMPEMDAVQTTTELREVLQLLDLPVYGLQFEQAGSDFEQQARQAGMNGVFMIPADLRRLFDALLNSPRQLPLF